MPAGRPNKPMELKILQSTDRADRTNTSAPRYPKIKTIPAVPPHLKKQKGASELWRRITGMLTKVGLLDQVNIDLIVLYISEVMIYRRSMEQVEDLGLLMVNDKGLYVANPARKIASDAMKNIMAIAREFGFTPSTRQKITTDFDSPTPTKKTRGKRKITAEDVAAEMDI